jgi:hypothetical protein
VVLPASGTATVTLALPAVPAGTPLLREYWQCLAIDSAGLPRLGSALQITVLNCSDLLPDCNGNGSCDSCDLLLPGALDCDKNGVPDECDPDCNANGIVDGCDLQHGTSLDLNLNGIPDECEAQTTWYVSASAAPGGNGSVAAPFQTIGAAFTSALFGDTVIVANGVYQGAANRELAFGSRKLTVKSSAGALNCIIDCQLQGRAFKMGPSTNSASLLEGFTIKNGMCAIHEHGGGVLIQGCNLTVRSCKFENCQTSWIENGGGMEIEDASPLIDGCAFQGNTLTTGDGAGANVESATAPRFKDCSFVGNATGDDGGALRVKGFATLERCLFVSNSADWGGAIHSTSISSSAVGEVRADQCLFAGNSATKGGAFYGNSGKVFFTNCTIVDNKATDRGGAFYYSTSSLAAPAREWRNTVIWNNTSTNGTPIVTAYGPIDLAWCDVQGGAASVTTSGTGSLIWGSGNMDLDPKFVDRDGPDNNPLTIADNDYRLTLNSSCVDAGSNAFVVADQFDLDGDGNVTEPVPYDFDGHARFVDVPSAPYVGSGTSPLVDFGPWERP